jgi:hypothetical protein
MPRYLELLKTGPKDWTFVYKLRVLAAHAHDDGIACLFKENSGCEFLVNSLLSCGVKGKGFEEVLRLMIALRDDSVFDQAKTIVPKLLEFFQTMAEVRPMISDVLAMFAKNRSSETTHVVFEHPNLLESALDAIDEQSCSSFESFLNNLWDRVGLLKICLQFLAQGTVGNTRFLGPFHGLLGSIDDMAVFHDVITVCSDLLPQAKGMFLSILCLILQPVLQLHPELSGECKSIVRYTVRIALATENDRFRGALLTLCQNMIQGSPDDDIIAQLRTFMDIETDRWNYKPASQTQKLPGFIGLRNLGPTCDMNSIFQQLFWTFPFRYLIATCQDMTDDSQLQITRIFTELLLSKRNFSDTQPFALVWKGWNKESSILVSSKMLLNSCNCCWISCQASLIQRLKEHVDIQLKN